MESLRASMILTIKDSSEDNGFGATATSDLSPRTSSSSIIKTIDIAALKAKPLSRSSKKPVILPSCRPQDSSFRRLIAPRMERSHSSVSSEVTKIWISLENILNFPKLLFIPMSELKSLRHCTKFRSILGKIWPSLYRINYQHGSPQTLKMSKRCIDTS